jgi:NCS1 family nucleobase:cation symporter-1
MAPLRDSQSSLRQLPLTNTVTLSERARISTGLKQQTWGTYDIFAFWMSDVHSVGGYVFAGSLLAVGLTSWQVLFSLLIGIVIVNVFCNLVAKPSQATGTPYPVVCRVSFGVLGANIPAMIRGLLAVAWYGIQTYLASTAFVVVVLKFFPTLEPLADVKQHGFLGLSLLGWGGFLFLWVLQALVFWNGIETIKRFIDFAGPAVYLGCSSSQPGCCLKQAGKALGLPSGRSNTVAGTQCR